MITQIIYASVRLASYSYLWKTMVRNARLINRGKMFLPANVELCLAWVGREAAAAIGWNEEKVLRKSVDLLTSRWWKTKLFVWLFANDGSDPEPTKVGTTSGTSGSLSETLVVVLKALSALGIWRFVFLVYGGGGNICAYPSSLETVSVGCAPTLSQYLTRPSWRRNSFWPFLSIFGEYVPIYSMGFPSRAFLASVATIL
jgi:hypothetical protein